MSYQIQSSKRSRVAGRFLRDVRAQILDAIDRKKSEEPGFTHTDLADALGVTKSVVSRRLNGKANLTLRSIADFAWATGSKISFALEKDEPAVVAVGSNYSDQEQIKELPTPTTSDSYILVVNHGGRQCR